MSITTGAAASTVAVEGVALLVEALLAAVERAGEGEETQEGATQGEEVGQAEAGAVGARAVAVAP